MFVPSPGTVDIAPANEPFRRRKEKGKGVRRRWGLSQCSASVSGVKICVDVETLGFKAASLPCRR